MLITGQYITNWRFSNKQDRNKVLLYILEWNGELDSKTSKWADNKIFQILVSAMDQSNVKDNAWQSQMPGLWMPLIGKDCWRRKVWSLNDQKKANINRSLGTVTQRINSKNKISGMGQQKERPCGQSLTNGRNNQRNWCQKRDSLFIGWSADSHNWQGKQHVDWCASHGIIGNIKYYL